MPVFYVCQASGQAGQQTSQSQQQFTGQQPTQFSQPQGGHPQGQMLFQHQSGGYSQFQVYTQQPGQPSNFPAGQTFTIQQPPGFPGYQPQFGQQQSASQPQYSQQSGQTQGQHPISQGQIPAQQNIQQQPGMPSQHQSQSTPNLQQQAQTAPPQQQTYPPGGQAQSQPAGFQPVPQQTVQGQQQSTSDLLDVKPSQQTLPGKDESKPSK